MRVSISEMELLAERDAFYKDVKQVAWKTMLHEYGHFLGLGHTFSATESSTEISIMDYNREIKNLEYYDVLAIKALYKE